MSKTCIICQKNKPKTQFYKNKKHKDNLMSLCKSCFILKYKNNKASADYRSKNLDYFRKYSNKYSHTEKGKLLAKKSRKKYYLKYKDRILCRSILNNAIQKGLILKQSCIYPNGKCRGRIEAHHWDYNKPLDVVWFCSKHHVLADKIQKFIKF